MGIRVRTATIAINAALSDAHYLSESSVSAENVDTLVGIQMSAGWTAAGIGLQVSTDGVTYQPLYDGATRRSLVVVAAQFQALDPVSLKGILYLKVLSETAGVEVNQLAARALGLVFRTE